MSFNPDHTKPAHEIFLVVKEVKLIILCFPVKRVLFHRHLKITLDSKLDFNGHINTVLSKVNKTIALLQKVQYILPRPSLLTIYSKRLL